MPSVAVLIDCKYSVVDNILGHIFLMFLNVPKTQLLTAIILQICNQRHIFF